MVKSEATIESSVGLRVNFQHNINILITYAEHQIDGKRILLEKKKRLTPLHCRSGVSADCEPVAVENLGQVALHLVQIPEALRPGEVDGGRRRRGSLLDGAAQDGSVVAHPSPDVLDLFPDPIELVRAVQLVFQEAQV